MSRSLIFGTVFFLCSAFPAFAESELFPFVISFDAPDNATNISRTLDAPAGKHGFVRVENGHFATDAGRIRFWGTNTCFGANFLDREKADRMAERLARFGTNCVRLHHMDMAHLWGGYGAKTKMEIDPAQLDRLDYFIAALKKRGIYVNMNLHVSRVLDERDGFPKSENRPSHDKGIDNYYRPFIDANKKYARDLLTHVNPYTGLAYKDEPAVAMIEINNENSIVCMWGGWGGLDVIQDPFLGALRKEWNDWLTAKYGDDTALRTAWKFRSEPLGAEMLQHADFANGYKPNGAGPNRDGWNWEIDGKVDATVTNENGVLRLDVRKKGEVSWHPQLIASGFAVKKGALYTLSYKAKASKEVPLQVGVRRNHNPWDGLGFDAQSRLGTEWTTFSYTFVANADDGDARVVVGALQEGVVYELDFVSLKQGGEIGPGPDQSLTAGTVPVIWKKDAGAYPKEAVDDFCDFLFDVEAKYWDEMHRFLKDEIGVKQPVSGTQLEYGSTYAQAKMDYCDAHAYWNHPVFPGRAWDGNNWYLHNRALVNHLDKEILPQLATKRVYGKPFTVSEYNHPYPNQYAAEGLPILAAFGAFQGWDGIFPFAYSHNDNPEPHFAGSFFDTAGNTVQTAHMIACRAMFCDNRFKYDADLQAIASMSAEREREIFKKDRHQYNFGFSGLGLDPRLALIRRTAVDVSGSATALPPIPDIANYDFSERIAIADPSTYVFFYDVQSSDRRCVQIDTRNAWLFSGFVEEGKKYAHAGNISIVFGKTNLGWATVSLARLGRQEDKPKRHLLVATGEMRNTDMKIEHLDGDKITVGNRWGKPPVLCEGITASLRFDTMTLGRIRCWALDESGNRKQEVPVSDENGTAINIDSKYKTIWYEIEH